MIDLYKDIQYYGPTGIMYENMVKFYEPHNISKEYITKISIDIFVKRFAYSVPTKKNIRELVDFIDNDKVLEIGSGSMLWSKLLQLNDVTVFPTDNMEFYKNGTIDKIYGTIENIDYLEAVKKYNDICNVLFVSWIDTNCSKFLEIMKSTKVKKLIYIGRCKCIKKFDKAINNKLRKNIVKKLELPKWPHSNNNDHECILLCNFNH